MESPSSQPLDGQSAIVTGASSGIGGAPLAFDVVSKRLEPLDAAGGEGAGGGFADAAEAPVTIAD